MRDIGVRIDSKGKWPNDRCFILYYPRIFLIIKNYFKSNKMLPNLLLCDTKSNHCWDANKKKINKKNVRSNFDILLKPLEGNDNPCTAMPYLLADFQFEDLQMRSRPPTPSTISPNRRADYREGIDNRSTVLDQSRPIQSSRNRVRITEPVEMVEKNKNYEKPQRPATLGKSGPIAPPVRISRPSERPGKHRNRRYRRKSNNITRLYPTWTYKQAQTSSSWAALWRHLPQKLSIARDDRGKNYSLHFHRSIHLHPTE